MTTSLTGRDGSDIVISDIVKLFTFVVVLVLISDLILSRFSPAAQTAQYIQSQMYQGVTDPRVCECVEEPKIIDLINGPPYTPWVSAQLVNDGPDSAWIAVNSPDDTFELKAGESATINRIGAAERINYLYGSAEAGESAVVRIVGEY